MGHGELKFYMGFFSRQWQGIIFRLSVECGKVEWLAPIKIVGCPAGWSSVRMISMAELGPNLYDVYSSELPLNNQIAHVVRSGLGKYFFYQFCVFLQGKNPSPFLSSLRTINSSYSTWWGPTCLGRSSQWGRPLQLERSSQWVTPYKFLTPAQFSSQLSGISCRKTGSSLCLSADVTIFLSVFRYQSFSICNFFLRIIVNVCCHMDVNFMWSSVIRIFFGARVQDLCVPDRCWND